MALLKTVDAVKGISALQNKPIPPRRVLMVAPDHFRIEYAINPHMVDSSGMLNQPDLNLAKQQWHNLKQIFERLGLKVEVLPAVAEFPDMVFAANQSLVFWERGQSQPSVLLSEMASPYRKGEVAYFRSWFEEQGYRVHNLERKNLKFEGNGDALPVWGRGIVLGGYGYRSDLAAYEELSQRFGLDIIPLKLEREHYYHLDTCLSVINDDTVALLPEAFHRNDLELVRALFPKVIEIEGKECLDSFAGNCHAPDGRHVIVQKGTNTFKRDVEKAGFELIEVDTSEFIKSGGSVFCLKMMVF